MGLYFVEKSSQPLAGEIVAESKAKWVKDPV